LIDSYSEGNLVYDTYSNLKGENLINSIKNKKINGYVGRPVMASGFLREINKALYGSAW